MSFSPEPDVQISSDNCCLCLSFLKNNPLTCTSCVRLGIFRRLSSGLTFSDVEKKICELEERRQHLQVELESNDALDVLATSQALKERVLCLRNKLTAMEKVKVTLEREIDCKIGTCLTLQTKNVSLGEEVSANEKKVSQLKKIVDDHRSEYTDQWLTLLASRDQDILKRRAGLLNDLQILFRIRLEDSTNQCFSICDLSLPPLSAFSGQSLDPLPSIHWALTTSCLFTQIIYTVLRSWTPFLLALAPQHLSTKHFSRDDISNLHKKLEAVLYYLLSQFDIPYVEGNPLLNLHKLCSLISSNQKSSRKSSRHSNSAVVSFDPHHVIAEMEQAYPAHRGDDREDWVEIAADYAFPYDQEYLYAGGTISQLVGSIFPLSTT